MSFATAFCSEAPVFFASDRSCGMAEGTDASKVPCMTILPAEFMLERLQEAYIKQIYGLDRGKIRPGTLLPRFLRRNRRSGIFHGG
jgi:hypothetical protein